MTPRHVVSTVKNGGRVRIRTSKHLPRIDIPLTDAQRADAFRQIYTRSDDVALPPEYTEFVERLARQSEQLVDILEQTQPSRKHVVAQSIDNMHEARDALPHMLHGFVRARIDAANPLSAHYRNITTYQNAKLSLHDALVNAKWRLPVSERAGPSVPEIIRAISDTVDGLMKDTMNDMRASRGGDRTR